MTFHNSIKRLSTVGMAALFLLLATGSLPGQDSERPDNQHPRLLRSLRMTVPYDLRHISHAWESGLIRLRIDPKGNVIDWIPINLPHYKLIPALDQALADARFSPAILNGEAVAAEIIATISLYDLNVYAVVNQTISEHIESRQAGMNPRRNQVILSKPEELDSPLELISESHGYRVVDEEGNFLTGTVEVEFYIDTEGYPRLLRPDPDADPLLAEAAMMTVEEFRFTPPTRRNQPTVAKARIPVVITDED